MADQENIIPTRRPQREAKIRAVAALCEQRKRKRVERVERVALGDLTNASGKYVSDIHKHKKRNIAKSKPVEESPAPENLEVKSVVKPEDPQLCGPYVSDIYDYLRNLEVILF
jgi:cyclin A